MVLAPNVLRMFDKMCSNEDWEMIKCMAAFLQVFKSATDVITGAKYHTISLTLLFRTEIERAVQITESDQPIVTELKSSIRMNLDRRFPIHEL